MQSQHDCESLIKIKMVSRHKEQRNVQETFTWMHEGNKKEKRQKKDFCYPSHSSTKQAQDLEKRINPVPLLGLGLILQSFVEYRQ